MKSRILLFLLSILIMQQSFAKSVFITAGNRGIGYALVEKYLNEWYEVYTTYRLKETSTDLLAIKNRKLHRFHLDILQENTVDDLKDNLKDIPLDLIIHNANYFPTKVNRGPDLDEKEWLKAFQVGVIFPIKFTYSLKKNLLKAKGGKVIFISSRRGSNTINDKDGYQGRYGYRTVKSALNSAVLGLSQDFKNEGIIANTIHPGRVSTKLTKFDGMSPSNSASNIYNTIESLNMNTTGNLIDSKDGKIMPW